MSDPMASLRAEVMAQPPAERVEYALDLLEFYLDPVPDFFEGCRRLGLDLPPAEVRMLHAMDAKRGRYVSINSLLAARCLDMACDDWPPPARVITGVKVIRRALEAAGLPVVITTWRRIGYCLDAPMAFRFEAAAGGQGGAE